MSRRLAALAGLMLALVVPGLPLAWSQPPASEPAAQALPAAFDLRTLDCVTPIKQQLGGTCWTHGTIAAIESQMLISGFWKAAGRDAHLALSEYHLDWWNGFNKHHNEDLADPAKDPTGLRTHQGGDYRVSAAYLSRGEGVVVLPSQHEVFRDNVWYQKAPPRADAGYQRFYVRDIEWFTIGDNLEGIDAIKRRIMTDGALGTCYAAGRTYLARDNVHYQPLTARGNPNHAVAIIGWDDTKLSTDAEKRAPKPGAWLIKNSWGMRRGEQGYYWISYYDKHCCRHPEMGAVSFRNIEPLSYTDIYSHDYHGWRDTLKDVSKAFNAFTATGRQLLRAVSFYTTKHAVAYTARIYRSFEKGRLQGEVAVKSGTVPFAGFHTVNLDVPVLVHNQEKFYVVLELSGGGQAIDRTSQIPVLLEQRQPRDASGPWVISKANLGESFYWDGAAWKDLYEYRFDNERFNRTANFCVKALAVSVEESPLAKAPAIFAGLAARSIGPANMGGRITDVDVVESNPNIMYIAAATGGVWKTIDAGVTWAPIFDQQTTLCVGDVAVSQSNPDIVWVGTGEANILRSVSIGDGVYKSMDGGKTWTHMGLKESRHVGRIVIHPKNPDIVYVAAVGHAWGANKDRGLYKTADGGKTWQRVKFIDDNTGFIDVAMDPSEPDTLYAAAYQVRRDAFSGMLPRTQWGPGAGLYKTEDAGKTWTKLTQGLPDRPFGRCGLSIYRKDPRIVYAVVQTDRTSTGIRQPGKQAQEQQNGPVELGGVFRSEDKGKTWTKVNNLCPLPFFYGQVRVDPNNDQRIYVLGISFHVSADGGKTFGTGARNTHPDHHALWINPQDSDHLVLGNDGGLYFSKDQGKSWEAQRGMAIGQFYAIGVDMQKPYRVYGGLQDNGSWGGPTATDRADGIALTDWRRVAGSDGFYCQVDPNDPDTVYCEGTYGALQRVNLKGGQPKRIRPAAATGQPAYRFNWSAPLLVSPHNAQTLYFGGNFLFKSDNRGDKWDTISPDLTRGVPTGAETQGRFTEQGHTITTVAESPLKAGLLWVGTDDGRLHVSRNGGKEWADLTDKLPGLPADRWVTRVECSHHAEGTAYVSVSRHRNDDLRPYVFKTTDHGATWTRLANNLPEEGPVHVIRESSKNKELLFAGTEFGLFASLDGGRRWHHLKNGLPPAVTVHDLVIHPRERELVIGTHGRSIYVLDIAPLEELSLAALKKDAHLFDVKPALAFTPREPGEAKTYRAANPPYGTAIGYYLRNAAPQPVSIAVMNGSGKPVAVLAGPSQAGLHQVTWNLRATGENPPLVEPGEYTVTLKVNGKALTKTVRVEAPATSASTPEEKPSEKENR